MDIRLILLFFLSVVAVSVIAYPKTACGSEAWHDLIVGHRVFGDRLLVKSHEKMTSSFLRVKSRDFVWKLQDNTGYITRIEVFDLKADGTGGCAFLVGGGVGQNYLRLRMNTQRGGVFDFFIRVYGN